MAQNTSTAVMQRRHSAPDSLDYFPTPPWATRALCEWLGIYTNLKAYKVWEPACGEMHMARPLAEYFIEVRASDIHQYGHNEIYDFPTLARFEGQKTDFVITNPPFMLAEEFINTSMDVARVGFAMLVRTAFLEGQERYKSIFNVMPPTHILQFTERVLMLKDRLVQTGSIDPAKKGDDKRVTSATAYCWIVWVKWGGNVGTRFEWVAPCRTRLEVSGDYPNYPVDEFVPMDGLWGSK